VILGLTVLCNYNIFLWTFSSVFSPVPLSI
jgi:hypothetical protein